MINIVFLLQFCWQPIKQLLQTNFVLKYLLRCKTKKIMLQRANNSLSYVTYLLWFFLQQQIFFSTSIYMLHTFYDLIIKSLKASDLNNDLFYL